MFAARDQENLAAMHQSAAHRKQNSQEGTLRGLQPKTPGARYPKTPLKVPLNDENAACGLGGKSNLGNKPKVDKSQWVTPAEPRTGRAVLGDKTTNAKTRNNQPIQAKTPALREIEKSQVRPTAGNRPKQAAPRADASKLQILLDRSDPLSDDVDVNPAPPPEQPYESDVFPAGYLSFDAVKPENRLKGYYDFYHNRRDENGMTRVDREQKVAQDKRFKEADARIRKDMDEITWDLGLDSPKKIVPLADPTDTLPTRSISTKAASTVNSRRAASALGMASKTSSTALQRKPLSTKPAMAPPATRVPSFMQPTKSRQPTTTTLASRPKAEIPSSSTSSGITASRSTLGYNKGRNVSSALHSRSKSEVAVLTDSRFKSTKSAAIRPTIHAAAEEKPEFVSIFDRPPGYNDNNDQLFESGDDAGLCGVDDTAGVLAAGGEDEDDFRLELDL